VPDVAAIILGLVDQAFQDIFLWFDPLGVTEEHVMVGLKPVFG